VASRFCTFAAAIAQSLPRLDLCVFFSHSVIVVDRLSFGPIMMRTRILALLSSLWFICAGAFVGRGAFLWFEQHEIPHVVLADLPFAQETGNVAYALSEGKGFANVFRRDTGPTAWLTPVYPLLIAGIFRLFGAFTFSAYLASVLLNSLFSAATCIPIFFAARKIAGSAAAILAAWLWALFPNAVMIPVEWIWDTSLCAFFAATLLWVTLELVESSRIRDWCGYGLLWGFALLNDPVLGALLPFLIAWLIYRRSAKRLPAWKLPAAAFALSVLCCIPWTIRNYVDFHRLVPMRSNFPFELWLGNNNIFDPHAIHGIQAITRYGQARLYSQLGENAFMQEKWRDSISFIRAHPGLAMRLTGRRIVATWLGTEHPFADFLSTRSSFARVVLLCNLLVLAGTLAGLLILFLRRNAYFFPLAVYPLVFPLVYYITHTSFRYRHPADPALMILAAVSLLGFRAKTLKTPPPRLATKSI
jgi:Dolichyl-phosphate-mannose-protein mannosyltransferase